MRQQTWLMVALAALVGRWPAVAQAMTIDLLPVGNPGNAGELSGVGAGGSGPDATVGAVAFTYNIGKYEVTAEQYTDFLNAVAATDAFGLYHTSMGGDYTYGCGIQRSGVSGGYAYTVRAGWTDHPVNYVSWGDAARFANWLENGQPTGEQGPSTTEDGSYYLNGATSNSALMSVTRKSGATWVLPTEDEWYKAAYHKNDGVTGNYWDYPTGTDSTPSNVPGDTGNSANFYDGDYTAGFPYYTTPVGTFGLSESPYGTFDQGGNLREWNETVIAASRGWRGGSWYYGPDELMASARSAREPTAEFSSIGFRVARVPEHVSVAGDADLDGDVDIFDVAIIQRHYGTTSGAEWTDGNFDGNGTVDIFDVALTQVNYGYGVASSPAPVPEPSTLVLGVLGVPGIMIGWWRRQKAA
jgi:formylglycine-generating enzyme